MTTNRNMKLVKIQLSAAASLLIALSDYAEVKLPAIFGDHMVLQQGSALPVWGWAERGDTVTVSVAGQRVTTTAGGDGKWRVNLEPLNVSGEPTELTVVGKNTITLKDVLIGEVWVCSGQSNMEWPLNATFNAKEESARARFPQIRFFKVAHKVAFEPQADCEGSWVVCTPETALTFSGVGYYFSRDLYQSLARPVGMIGSHWSGTPAQAWTSLEMLRAHKPLKPFVDYFEKLCADRTRIEEEYITKTVPEYEAALKRWQAESKESVRKKPAPPKYECRTKRADNPTVLNNGMIAPLIPFAIKGVIWYQGESNANDPALYRILFPALITDWRKNWGQGDFPFIFVQLCSGAGDDVRIPLMREAQESALALPNTGMAVTLDIGEPKNPRLHPRNKRDVGVRLALAAGHVAYGQALVYSGPIYKSMKIDRDQVRLSFDHVGGGLIIAAAPTAKENDPPNVLSSELKGFTIAGTDRKFVQAQARIEGENVVVWSEQVTKPVAVRYAWVSFPDANLYNKEGLPAASFRTDDWK